MPPYIVVVRKGRSRAHPIKGGGGVVEGHSKASGLVQASWPAKLSPDNNNLELSPI